MSSLEFLGAQQRVQQIRSQQHGKYRSNPVFQLHFSPLKSVAGRDVSPTDGKENDRQKDKDYVLHSPSMIIE